MRKLLTLILILCTIAAPAQMRGGSQYDPGAIRSDGTNASDTVTLNRIKTATGTAAAPVYSFSSDPDTGIYSPGANVLGFGVGGADVASLSSTGLSLGTPLSVANGGTAATDAATARTNLGVAYGTAEGTVCQGNDARLSDARTPVAHEHSGVDITSGTVADARIDATICRDSELTTHENLTAAHGATGAVMGTTNTQTVTNKTMGSGCSWGGTAIPVANGGTGATTAAEGLAALGGASLNGSSTVDFAAAKVTAAAYDTEDGDLLDMMAMINGYNPKRWGIRITKAETDPATRVTYLYDAVGMTPVTMNFASNTINYGDWKPFCDAINRPVMVNPDGSVAYELDPNDQTKKLDGTASGISSTTHSLNAMAEFKRLWLRTYEDANYQYIIFSNVQYDENYHANAFTTADGTVRDRMYYAMYEGSDVSSKLRSLATGAMMADQTAATEITYAESNGAGWHINYKSQRDFITYLLALISKSTDSQAVFGQGNSDSAAYIAPGALKATGRFWGDDATNAAVKVFFIEHFWGNYWKRLSGLLYNDVAHVLIKASAPYSLTGVGYTDTGITPTGTSGQYMTAGTLADAGFIPTTAGGSDSTYFSDCLYYAAPAAGVFNVALVGGSRLNAGGCGSWACVLHDAGSAATDGGASLSFLKP